MNKENLDKYRKAGKIARKAKEKSKDIIEEGKNFLKVAEDIEQYIKNQGAEPAFPVNLSVNNKAAHYTPGKETERKFNKDQVVKIDIGTHIDGYVGGDTAYTLDFTEENTELIEASKEALENALALVKAGRKTNEIGEEIQETIEEKGFKPVRNLTGHGLGKWNSHRPPSIPNIKINHSKELEEGQVIAIEPFASTGKGMVKSGKYTEIYSHSEDVSVRDRTARKVLKQVKENYHSLPFAKRWISEDYNPLKLKLALKKLTDKESLKTYPVLKDNEGSLVSQAENTVIVQKDGCEVLTD